MKRINCYGMGIDGRGLETLEFQTCKLSLVLFLNMVSNDVVIEI